MRCCKSCGLIYYNEPTVKMCKLCFGDLEEVPHWLPPVREAQTNIEECISVTREKGMEIMADTAEEELAQLRAAPKEARIVIKPLGGSRPKGNNTDDVMKKIIEEYFGEPMPENVSLACPTTLRDCIEIAKKYAVQQSVQRTNCPRCAGKGYFMIGSDECKCYYCDGAYTKGKLYE